MIQKGEFIRLVVLSSVDLASVGCLKKGDYQDYLVHDSSIHHIEIKKSKKAKSVWIPKTMIDNHIIHAPQSGIIPPLDYEIRNIKNTQWRRFLYSFWAL